MEDSPIVPSTRFVITNDRSFYDSMSHEFNKETFCKIGHFLDQPVTIVPGQALMLCHDPTSKYSERYSITTLNGQMIGYLEKKLAEEIYYLHQNGRITQLSANAAQNFDSSNAGSYEWFWILRIQVTMTLKF